MSVFSTRLKALRIESGLSQQEFAERLRHYLPSHKSISKSSINMYERGEREPSLDTLEAIARLYDVDLNYLLGQSESRILQDSRIAVGQRIRNQRNEWRLTQKQLADKCGISVNQLSKYENNKLAIPISDLRILAAKVTVEKALEGAKPPKILTLEEALDAPIVWAVRGKTVFPCRLNECASEDKLEVQRFGRTNTVDKASFLEDFTLYGEYPPEDIRKGDDR